MIGVKVISEIAPSRRGAAILGLIGLSWLALLAFAVVPAPWNVAALFLNGLPLGMIWGLVFGFMEGRRTSEVLGAILCASFILSSGVVKSVGKWLMVDLHVSPFWMPAATGAIFLPLLAVSVWALVQLPPPSPADEAARVRRQPMDRAQRRAFLAVYAPGIVLLVMAYMLLTALRDFRDNFAAELWTALGLWRGFGRLHRQRAAGRGVSLAVMGAVMLVRDNLRALLVMHGVILAGFLLLGLSTLAFQAHLLSPLTWMILTGAGLYMAYTPFNAMLFDRMIAFSGRVGTAGFLIYVADASGYLGSVALLVWRNFAMVNWTGWASSSPAPTRRASSAPSVQPWPASTSCAAGRLPRGRRSRPRPSSPDVGALLRSRHRRQRHRGPCPCARRTPAGAARAGYRARSPARRRLDPQFRLHHRDGPGVR
jgi:hypothetical protein